MVARKRLRRPIFTTDNYIGEIEPPPAGHNQPPESIAPEPILLQIPPKFACLFDPARIKCFYGGRGGAKSHSFARALIAKAHTEKHLILCTRQFQSSIADSVHRTLVSQIIKLGLEKWFIIEKTSIKSIVTGSEFIFKGIYPHPQEIKSLEGVTICWVEEAQAMTEDSWLILEPTIRENDSEIWVSYNPESEDAPTHQRMLHWAQEAQDPNAVEKCIVCKVGWQDNPWFPNVLDRQRRRMLALDAAAYDWVWEGHTRRITNAAIFKDRYEVRAFETPEDVDRFYYGADWGFANDPSVLMRCFIIDDVLYVDYEAYGIGVELEDLPFLFAGGKGPLSGVEYPGIPGAKNWPIVADSSRPETISYVARNGGMAIAPADKWQGSVEDGIAHLKTFRKIVIHERCTNLAMEARLYSYKVDPKQLDANKQPVVLPIVVDKHNHGWDSLRYALVHFIKDRGNLAIWERLAS
jgi:phage terminase large subunit